MAHKLKSIAAAGFKGINSDLMPWDLSAEFITSGQNFRIDTDKIISTGAEEDWSVPTVSASWYWHTSSGPPVVGFLLYDVAVPNQIKMHKFAQSVIDMTDYIEALQIGDYIYGVTDGVLTIAGITDMGTYMVFDTVEDGALSSTIQTTTFPDRFTVRNSGHVRPVDVPAGQYWLVAQRDAVLCYDGSEVAGWTDVSSAVGYGSIGIDGELNWNSCMLGTIPVLNNIDHVPEMWTPQTPATILTPLPFDAVNDWAAKGYRCKVIRSFKNYLIALYLIEGAVDLPSTYRWSHPADNNGYPPSWDETDISYIAGKAQIGGDFGSIVDGRTLRDSFMIYSTNGINVLDESYDEFVFRRRVLSSNIGLLNTESIVEIKNVHYFIGDGDIYRNDGNNVVSVIHGKLRKRFNAQASSEFFERSYAVQNIAEKEIWFCIPETGSEFPDTAFVYNWSDDSWAIQKIPNTVAHSAYGPQASPPSTFDTVLGSFDDMSGVPFDTQSKTPLNDTVIGVCNITSCLKILDPAVTQSEDLDSFIERIGYPLDGQLNVNTVVRIYPMMEATGPVMITVGSQKFAGAPIEWKSSVEFNPEMQRKLDVRTTGMYLCWRIASIGTTMFKYSGMDVEYSPSGKR